MCIHLHVHCEYSLLDGLSTVKQLAKRAKEIGNTALAITDHGVCGAIPEFIKACKDEGIKPLPGCEAYMTRDRLKKGEFLKAFRDKICTQYSIKDKLLKEFIRHIERNPIDFEPMAADLLKDYLMCGGPVVVQAIDFTNQVGNMGDDLFSLSGITLTGSENFETEIETNHENIVARFKEEIYDYLQYDNYHLLLLAIDNKGLEDLYAIVSDAHINGFYSDPRTDLGFIREHNLGANIIATSACLGSWFSRLALAGRMDDAIAFVRECQETFHSFYLEKQATLIPDQLRLNAIIDEIAVITGCPKIVTTDVHYARKEDIQIHDILVAASTNKCIHDENRMRYAHEFWLKDGNEMRAMINDEEAIANTYKIADMINVDLPKKPLFPKFIIEDGDTAEAMLEKQCWSELFTYCLKKNVNFEKYAAQLKYELETINSLGFADYFLIVSDFINWAKRNNYRVGPGRGSAAGAIVAFLLKITTLDPIEWGFMFERFLNPERAGYPDIDIDFSYEGAKAVQEYLKQKYGADRVAQIGTYGTLAARSAIRKTGKALGYSMVDEDKFSKSIPAKPGITLDQALAQEPQVQAYARQYPDWWTAAKALEGHVSNPGVHAGGIVLSPEPLTRTVPLRTDSEDLITTQYDMSIIEKLLVKFDILKLDTLDLLKLTMSHGEDSLQAKFEVELPDGQMLRAAKRMIGDEGFDIDAIDLNDPKIYEEIYNKLNVSGIFQCESDLYKGIIKEMKPNCVQDITVIAALGRPGPMDLIPSYIRRKFGHEKITYPYDSLQPVLEETYGVWVYQEQIMKASIVLGGFTAGQSDMLRKGISKKDADLMNRYIDLMIYGSSHYYEIQAARIAQYPTEEMIPVDQFGNKTVWVDYTYEKDAPKNIPGAISRGYDEAGLLALKAQWIKFGEYCFNKPHAGCYAVLSVQTAFLKTYYPTEFMASLLTISGGKKDKEKDPKSILYMHECEDMGIRILPPDINDSMHDWTPIPNRDPNQKGLGLIRYGIASIAGVSAKDLEIITSYRPFASFDDFLQKNTTMKLNKTKVVALIKAGCFDRFGGPKRNEHLRKYFDFRGDTEIMNKIPGKTLKRDIIAYEREVLNMSVSVKSKWEMVADGTEGCTVTATIKELNPFNARGTGKQHLKMIVETPEDEIQTLVFNKTYAKEKDKLTIGTKVRITGNKSGADLVSNRIVYMTEELEKNDVEFDN